MKVIIPVAGIGSKLRPHTHTQPKTLLPIAGKPMLSHIVDSLIDGGLRDFVFVLGYLGDKIESFITSRYKDINVDFITQEPREGSAHAIWVCREYIRDEKEVLIVLGDTIASFDLKEMLSSPYSVLGVLKVSNPLQFGIAEMGNEGFIQKLVEKPRIPKSNLALVGIYKIVNTKLLIDSIEYVISNNIKINNEFYLTDALMKMIQEGEQMRTIQVDNWFDCGKKETLLDANAILLNINKHQNQIPDDLEESIIIPPVSIGPNCQVSHSIIGPNVAIGENTILKNTILSDSIIGSYSEIKDVVLKRSIVGNDTSIRGLSQSLNIGDNTEISFE